MKAFARQYGLGENRVRREPQRGFTGVPLKDKVHGGWIYPEYSALLGQSEASKRQANKGPRSVVTNKFAEELVKDLEKGHAVATSLLRLKKEGWKDLPKPRTVYYHLKEGVIVLPKGKLRYRPRKTKKRHIPKRGKNVVQSSQHRGASCGNQQPCLIDRRTRYTVLGRLPSLTQTSVNRALRRLVAEGTFPALKSITTDNGKEFLNQRMIEKILGVPVYYTHAYSSYEKGSVEQTNGIIRFWWGKGTDFSRVSHREVAHVQHLVNSISRTVSLKGLTAYETISALS